jgi:hypothetical protein
MLVDWLASNELLFGLLYAAAWAFIWNGARRTTFEDQWRHQMEDQPFRIPESMVFYGAKELKAFAETARKVRIEAGEDESGLSFYSNSILRGCDLAYAVALATLTAYVWFRLALHYAPTAPNSWLSSAVVWFAPYCAAMAIAYGLADIAEDLKLASILWPLRERPLTERLRDQPLRDWLLDWLLGERERVATEEIDRAEAAAANMLTIIKMITLLLSVIGFILFLLLLLLQSAGNKLSGTLNVAKDEFLKWYVRRFRRERPRRPGPFS